MSRTLDVMRDTFAALEEVGIEWALTGSFALAIHGAPRATHDIDIQVAADLTDEPTDRAFSDAMRKRGFRRHYEDGYERDGWYVEFFSVLNSVNREGFENRKRLSFGELAEIWVVSPEELIISKCFEASQGNAGKHIDDIRRLLVLRRNNLNFERVENFLQRFPEALRIYDQASGVS